jgi:hypothetical protein
MEIASTPAMAMPEFVAVLASQLFTNEVTFTSTKVFGVVTAAVAKGAPVVGDVLSVTVASLQGDVTWEKLSVPPAVTLLT